ncbi:MAG: right-handed parallel beta-helix repeat-containing protein, partial [Methanobrevibacter sp.]
MFFVCLSSISASDVNSSSLGDSIQTNDISDGGQVDDLSVQADSSNDIIKYDNSNSTCGEVSHDYKATSSSGFVDYVNDSSSTADISIDDDTSNNIFNGVDSNSTVKLDDVYVSTNGSNSNNGNIDAPVKTIEYALSIVNEGGNIHVSNGGYNENDLNIAFPVTIIGDNATINGNGKGRIFNITTSKGDFVSIFNINFINGYNDQSAGAIYVKDAKVKIDNCSFTNNTAGEGGAILWNGDNGTIVNSCFNNNIARTGGAVSWGGLLTSSKGGKNGQIINCTFNNNTASNYGGSSALAAYANNLMVYGTNFTNNHGLNVTDNGALYACANDIIVDNCLFENNTMESQGAAIRIEYDNVQVINSVFINNTLSSLSQLGTNKEGGAIEVLGDGALIKNNTFIDNGGQYCERGGAIVVLTYYGYSTNIEDNIFINNSANSNGGAVYVESVDGSGITVNLNNNLFDGDVANMGYGIYSSQEADLNIADNTFKNMNNDNAAGLAIYAEGGNMNLENNTITNCGGVDSSVIYFDYGAFNNAVITVNNNSTNSVLIGDTVPITVTVCDDNGNLISGGSVTITSNGTTVKSLSNTNGTLSLDYTVSKAGDYILSASYDSVSDATINTATLNVVPVYNSEDLQKLINDAEAGSTLDLGNMIFKNISNVNITKNIVIVGGNITGSDSPSPIFVVSNKSTGVNDVKITGGNYYLNNDDIVVLASTENGANPNRVEISSI